MNRVLKIYPLLVFLLFGCESHNNPPESDSIKDIPLFDVFIEPESLERLRANKLLNYDAAMRFRVDNGELLHGIIRSSGAGSRYYYKWSFKFEVQDTNLYGLSGFNLSSQINDPTSIYSVLCLDLYEKQGFLTFDFLHTFLRINTVDEGLYPLIEKIDKEFFERRNIDVFELYKAGFEADLNFGEDDPRMNYSKKIPDKHDFSSLLELIRVLNEISVDECLTELDKYIDVKQYLKYHATASVIGSPDSFRNNYYLYKEYPESKFKIIPWDFDRSYEKLSKNRLCGDNALIRKVLKNKECLQLYKDYAVEFAETYFTENHLFPIIDSTQAKIELGYQLDPFLGKDRYILDEEVVKLKEFISEQRQYFLNNIESFEGLE